MKTAKDYMTAANAVVERISIEDALTKHGAENTVFVDVRDSGDIAKTGTVAGAVRINRGFLEFAADDNTQYHNANLTKNAHLYMSKIIVKFTHLKYGDSEAKSIPRKSAFLK